MSDWATPKDLAGLPGMPGTAKNVARTCERLGINRRPNPGRGGGFEYLVADLPRITQCAFNARFGLTSSTDTPPTSEGPQGDNAGSRRALQRDASFLFLERFEAWFAAQKAARPGLGLYYAEREFCECYNAGELDRVDGYESLSRSTLARWRLDSHKRHAIRADRRKLDALPSIRDLWKGLIVEHPHTSFPTRMTILRSLVGADVQLARGALYRYERQFRAENAQVLSKLHNPDAWKNKFMVAFGKADARIKRINQRWELDSSPADLMLTDGRHMLLGVIDVYTRRMKLLVSKTSKAVAVGALVRAAILDWGVPEEVGHDNGQEYVSTHMQRVWRSLSVTVSVSPPFTPEAKPFIERAFQTFSHGLLEVLPGFIGHNVAERKALEARASFAQRLFERGGCLEVSMSSEELQSFCDRWCTAYYEHRAHGGLNGQTPFLRAAGQQVARVRDERALDVLLAEPAGGGIKTVTKRGLRFTHPGESEPSYYTHLELTLRIGQRVEVRWDPMGSLGRLYVFDLHEQFVCIAECPEILGVDRAQYAAAARKRQREWLSAQAAALRKLGKGVKDGGSLAAAVLRGGDEERGKLAAFTPRPIEYSSAGLDQAVDALVPTADPVTPIDMASHSATVAAWQAQEAAPVDPFAVPEDPFDRHLYMQAIESRIAASDISVAQIERQQLRVYVESGQYQFHQEIYEEADLIPRRA